MLKAIRYVLAAICLAASVGCLALWPLSRSSAYELQIRVSASSPKRVIVVAFTVGYLALGIHPERTGVAGPTISFVSQTLMPYDTEGIVAVASNGRYYHGFGHLVYYLPLWYPALVLALAAVAAIRIGRQFTLRSALVGMGVVAALLGMAVAM